MNGNRKDGHGMMVGGLIIMSVGIIFLLDELDIIPSVGRMWPLFPIIVGFAMIVGSFRSRGTSRQ